MVSTIFCCKFLHWEDLLKENQRLMDTVRKQSLSLQAMEKRYPGITTVKRDPGGAVIIDEDLD